MVEQGTLAERNIITQYLHAWVKSLDESVD